MYINLLKNYQLPDKALAFFSKPLIIYINLLNNSRKGYHLFTLHYIYCKIKSTFFLLFVEYIRSLVL